MVVRNIKFPLKMKNGAEVRSLEELRKNADIESIMEYYCNGKLKKWCKAFGLNEIADEVQKINTGYVKKILDTLGVELSEETINEYVLKNFGNNSGESVLQITADIEEEKANDSKDIKEEIKTFIHDDAINPDDYVIDVLPVWNDSGKIEKYRVIITNEKTEQYNRFSFYRVSNEENDDELYKEHLTEKIVYEIKEMKKSELEYQKREERVKDSKDIRDTIKALIHDETINLDDYVIDVLPVWKGDGRIEKYRVIITNKKTDQYYRFSFWNEEIEDYNEELFKKDLTQKIVYAIEEMKKNQTEYEKRRSILSFKYSSLNKGEVFEFGEFEGKKLKWKVLDIKDESIYVLCETIICEKAFDDSGRRSNNWKSSTLRKWLNKEFYNKAFDEDEKKSIKEENSDKVILLSKEEAEGMMTQQERSLGSHWWLRSAYPRGSDRAWCVCNVGSLYSYSVSGIIGVRPALNLKL